jgi:hypothetical protein
VIYSYFMVLLARGGPRRHRGRFPYQIYIKLPIKPYPSPLRAPLPSSFARNSGKTTTAFTSESPNIAKDAPYTQTLQSTRGLNRKAASNMREESALTEKKNTLDIDRRC